MALAFVSESFERLRFFRLELADMTHKCRSAERFSTFKRSLNTELFDIAYSRCKQSVYTTAIMRLIRLRHMADQRMCFARLIDSSIPKVALHISNFGVCILSFGFHISVKLHA